MAPGSTAKQVARYILHNSDRIEFGVKDSYQLTFSLEKQDIQRLLEQFGSTSRSGSRRRSADYLVKLRSLGRSGACLAELPLYQRSVDSGGGCSAGCHQLRARLSVAAPEGDKNADLTLPSPATTPAVNSQPTNCAFPAILIRRALASRRDLLSMSFDPFEEQGVRPEMT